MDASSRQETLEHLIRHRESARHQLLILQARSASSSSRPLDPSYVDGSPSNATCTGEFFLSHEDSAMEDPPPRPEAFTIENTTDQSEGFTRQLLLSTADRNPCLGNFLMKENTERYMSARHIVSMACEKNCRRGHPWTFAYDNPAPLYGTEFMFAYTQIFSELSVKSREKFVRIVDVAMDAKPSDRLEPSRFGRAQVPSTVNDAYRICLRGSHAIAASLPVPRTVTVGSQKAQHACVYPLDVIQYCFAIQPANVLAGIPTADDWREA